MLSSPLIHPPILSAVAAAGHGSLILVTDANFPASTKLGPHAPLVYLNLRPGLVDAVEILRSLLTVMPVEETYVMEPMREGPYALAGDPPVWDEFRAALAAASAPDELKTLERSAFYEQASTPDVALSIVSGESRIYGNLLLRVGVVLPSG